MKKYIISALFTAITAMVSAQTFQVSGEVTSIGTNAGFRVNGAVGNNVNSAPWYGVGLSSLLFSGQTTGAVQLGGYNGLNLVTQSGQLVMLSSGYVGIGTAIPDQKLTVKGKIHAEEVIIDLAVPADYVFQSNYKLRPLHEVEAYVKENSHLPEIPSAAEIVQNGLSMGEMQNKLLQKVEELTLYVIEQQKQINGLKKQLRSHSSRQAR